MKNLPVIPADVPFCHKNYELANALASSSEKAPLGIAPKAFATLREMYEAFAPTCKSEGWYSVEDFFLDLKEKAEKGEQGQAQGDALASVDLDNAPSGESEETTETILDLKERPADRETKDLQDKVLAEMRDWKNADVKAAVNRINAAIDRAFSFTRSRHTERDSTHRRFDAKEAALRDLGRVNEKVGMAIPELAALHLYRAVSGEYTAMKSVSPNERVLFIMLDNSGSMMNSRKVALVNLVLLKVRERLTSRTKAYCWLFESDLHKSSVVCLNDKMPNARFNEGGTDVQAAIKTLFGEMKAYKTEQASILIINDGEDAIKPMPTPCKVSSLILGTKNEGLRSLCEKSGGVSFAI